MPDRTKVLLASRTLVSSLSLLTEIDLEVSFESFRETLNQGLLPTDSRD
jgi:hypothetical protein